MSSLNKILQPISKEIFLKDFWEKSHIYIKRNKNDYFSELLTINDLDTFLSRNDIRYPNIRMVKNGLELSLNEYSKILNFGKYSSDGLIDTDKIISNYIDGATILIQLAKSSFTSLSRFCNILQDELKSHIEANIYLTPKNSQGFTTHFDTHSVFVLQLDGAKRWCIYDTLYDLPTLEDTYKDSQNTSAIPKEEIILLPGDILYIPRGLGHDARTIKNEHSLHVTIGVFPPTWLDIFNYCLKDLHNNREFRKSPISFIENNNELLHEEFKEKCILLNNSVLEKSIESIRKFTNSKQTQLNTNRLNSLINIETLGLNTKVIKKKEILADLKKSGDYLILEFYDKKISLPIESEEFINKINGGKAFLLDSLTIHYDKESIIELANLLICEGLITIEN